MKLYSKYVGMNCWLMLSALVGCSTQPIQTEDVTVRRDSQEDVSAEPVSDSMPDGTFMDAPADVADASRDSDLILDTMSDVPTDVRDAVPDSMRDASSDASPDVADALVVDAMADVVAEDSAATSPRMDNVLYLTRDSRLLLYENTRYVREQSEFFEKLFLTLRYQDSGICTIAVFEFSDGVNHCRVLDSDGGRVFDPGGSGRIIVFDIDGGRDTIGTASPTYSGDYQFIGYHNDGGTLPPPGAHSYAVTIRPNPCFSTLSRVPGAVSVTISTSSSGGSGGCARSYVFPTVWSDAMRVSVER